MALPKLEFKGSKFSMHALMKELGEKLDEIFAPFIPTPPKKEEPGYQGAPGPIEWEEGEVATVKPWGERELVDVSAKKGFPEKKMMDSKKMHNPRVRKPKIKRGKVRGKLQKNL